ncbi:MAG: class I SAM-dependent methyltransferase [Coriobacteriia bacterium]
MDPQYLASFERIEKDHWWFRARREIVGDALRRHAPPGPGIFVDIGCGTGGNVAPLANVACCDVAIGIEPDAGARAACETKGLDVRDGTAASLPFDERSASAITMLDVMEHLDDDAGALAESARVLAPHGVLVVTVPAMRALWSPHDERNHHRRRYSLSQATGLVESAGFDVVEATYFNTLLLLPVALVRIAQRILRHGGASQERMPSPALNRCLYRVFSLERRWLACHAFPIGVSILVVGRRR